MSVIYSRNFDTFFQQEFDQNFPRQNIFLLQGYQRLVNKRLRKFFQFTCALQHISEILLIQTEIRLYLPFSN